VIDRRRFLKALGLGSVAAALGVWPRAEPSHASSVPRASASPAKLGQTEISAMSASSMFRGDRSGMIYISRDGGATWTRHSHLGAEYSVRRVRTSRSGLVRLDVGYRGRSFKLILTPDERAWRTA
jgi:hypothetical protein